MNAFSDIAVLGFLSKVINWEDFRNRLENTTLFLFVLIDLWENFLSAYTVEVLLGIFLLHSRALQFAQLFPVSPEVRLT